MKTKKSQMEMISSNSYEYLASMRECSFPHVGKSSFVNDNEASFRRYRTTRFTPRGESTIGICIPYADVEGKKKNTTHDHIP